MICEFNKLNAGTAIGHYAKILMNNADSIQVQSEKLRDALQKFYTFQSPESKEALKTSLGNWIDMFIKSINANANPNQTLVSIATNLARIKENLDSVVDIVSGSETTNNKANTNISMEFISEEDLEYQNRVEFNRLNDLYHSAQQARTAMLKDFRRRVISAMFVDFKQGKIVQTEKEYNDNITHIMNDLVNDILRYGRIKGITGDIVLFNPDGTYTGRYNEVSEVAKTLFNNITDKLLNSFFEKRVNPENAMALNAYNAWVMLNNFDMLIKNLLGKSISIDPRYTGHYNTFVNSSEIKYRLNSESNLVKTWRNNENIDALLELGKVTNILIESTPMLSYKDGLQLFDQTIEVKDFMYAMMQVKRHPKLQQEIIDVKYNPIANIPKLLKAALDPSIKFQQNDTLIKNILYSVLQHFFATNKNHDAGEEYSLKEILDAQQEIDPYIKTLNLLSFIASAIDKSIPNDHIQYVTDELGIMRPRIVTSTSVDSMKIILTQSINNINDAMPTLQRDALIGTIDKDGKLLSKGRYWIGHIGSAYLSKWTITSKMQLPNGQYSDIKITFLNTLESPEIAEITVDNKAIDLSLDNIITESILTTIIDDTLQLNFKRNPQILQIILELKSDTNSSSKNDILKDFASLGLRVLIKHSLDQQFEVIGHLPKEILDYYGAAGKISKKALLNQKTDKVNSLIRGKFTSNLMGLLAQARAILNGDVSKQTFRNLDGNAMANTGLTNLMSTIKVIFNDARLKGQKDSSRTDGKETATKHTIFALNPALLKGVALKTDASSLDGLSHKSDKEFTVGESGYSAFMFDFLERVGTDSSIAILPTTYSDKTSDYLAQIDLSLPLGRNYARGKKLIDMSPIEVLEAHYKSMSKMYRAIKANITLDYRTVFLSLEDNLPKNLVVIFSMYDTAVSRITDPNVSLEEKTILLQIIDNHVRMGLNLFANAKEMIEKGSYEIYRDVIFPEINNLYAKQEVRLKYLSSLEILNIFEKVNNNELLTEEEDQKYMQALSFLKDVEEFRNSLYGKYKNSVDLFQHLAKKYGATSVLFIQTADNKKLTTNRVLDFYFSMFDGSPSGAGQIFNDYMDVNRNRFARHIVSNFKIDYRIRIPGQGWKVNPIITKALEKLTGLGYEIDPNTGEFTKYEEEWVDSDTEELIVGMYLEDDGNYHQITKSNLDRVKGRKVKLNPLFDMYFSLDNLLSTQFVVPSVGGCYGHKDLFKGEFSEEMTDLEKAMQEEAGRALTLFKRMVIYPATMHNYSLECINGISPILNVAIIKDVPASVFNHAGDLGDIDAHDGSGFCLPWVANWQNFSLGDAAGGEDSKPIGHWTNHEYAMGGEFKWALFSLSNERSRTAGRVRIDIRNMIQKMSSNYWLSDQDIEDGFSLDITKHFKSTDSNPIENTLELINEDGIFYLDANGSNRKNPIHYRLINIVKVDLSSAPVEEKIKYARPDSVYKIVRAKVDQAGRFIDNDGNVSEVPVIEEYTRQIASNFDIWETFGGELSEKLVNGTLVFGNTSSDAVTFYGNNVGILRRKPKLGEAGYKVPHPELTHLTTDREGNFIELRTEGELLTSELTLMDVWQPLKFSDTHYLVNFSGNKNGQTNVNEKEQWYTRYDRLDEDTHLWTTQVSSVHMGVQMDADHHADDAEITEMSLVISALEENGYTHEIAKQAYEDLGAIVEATLKEPIRALLAYYNIGDTKLLYRIVGRAFIKSFANSTSSRSNLTDAIVYNLQQELAERLDIEDADMFIPFSDNNILGTAISTITSNINKSAIKRKYAGIAAVMIPAYDMIKIFRYNGKDYLNGSLIREGIDMNEVQYQYENEVDENGNLVNAVEANLLLLGHSYIEVNINTGVKTEIEIDTLEKYEKYRAMDNSHYFIENLRVGRNLQPSNTTFTIDGYNYNIYDCDEIRNRILFVKWLATYKKQSNNIEFLTRSFIDANGTISIILKNSNNDPEISSLITKILGLISSNLIWKLPKYVDHLSMLLQQKVVDAYKRIHEEGTVYIANDLKTIDLGSLKVKEAELVLSKIYKTIFGLKEGITLDLVNEQFFFDLISNNMKINSNYYDIALKRNDGNHTYIILKGSDTEKRLTSMGLTLKNPPTMVDPISGDIVRIDLETNLTTPFNDSTLYVDSNGIEYIVTDDILQFIDSETDYESIDMHVSNDAETNKKVSEKILSLNGNVTESFKKKFNKKTLEALELGKITYQKLINELHASEENLIRIAARKKFISFLESLNFTAARIPSQAMQSFMPMKVVAFTESEDNKAYVSHFQAFLQGSDYDIDKVYLLGNEFSKAGMYIGWSPLFDLTSQETLEASKLLPMSSGKTIDIVSENFDGNLDITEQISKIHKYVLEMLKFSLNKLSIEYTLIKANYIKALAKLITFINKSDLTVFYCSLGTLANDLRLNTVVNTKELDIFLKDLSNIINLHNTYLGKIKSLDTLIKITKNSASSKIRRIISDPANTVQAYCPIEMQEPKDAAKQSALGKEEREYSLGDPSVKWIMHNQNMVGKKAIGITAVGAKVLFALLYYYNEVARGSNIDKQKRAYFYRSFELSSDPSNLDRKVSVIKNIIANVNPEVIGEDHVWTLLIKENVRKIESGEILSENKEFAADLILMQLSIMKDSSLINSALLSAATDNAKELILSKINATPDFLKVYTYSIILGIDFNDIAGLMTSETVNMLAELSKENIFTDKTKLTLNVAMNIVEKGLRISDYNLISSSDGPEADIIQKVINLFKEDSKHKTPWQKGFESVLGGTLNLNDFIEQMLTKVNSARELMKKYNLKDLARKNTYRYLERVEEVLDLLSKSNAKDYATFKKMFILADEFNVFGSILGINLGIATDLPGKLNYLDKIESVVNNRVKYYKDKGKLSPALILKDKPYLYDLYGRNGANDKIQEVCRKAMQLDIVDNFNALQFLQDPEYALAAIEFYDLIKGTVNVLDALKTIPHFNSMSKAAAIDFMMGDVVSSRVAFTYNLSRQLKTEFPGMNAAQKELFNRDISNFILDTLTTKFFKEEGIKILISKSSYFNAKGLLVPIKNGSELIDLGTLHGQATFKYWMEHVVIPRLKQGKISDNVEDVQASLVMNKFLQDLQLTTSNKTQTGDLKYMYALPMNMSNIQSVADTNLYINYLTAFNDLASYTYNDIPVPLLFFYYNLLVNKNQYGLNALTRLFETQVMQNGGHNKINDYFNKIGLIDRTQSLSIDDFDIEDLRMACAMKVSLSLLSGRYLGPYIKVYNPNTKSFDIFKYEKDAGVGYSEEDEDLMWDEIGGEPDMDYDEDIDQKELSIKNYRKINIGSSPSEKRTIVDNFTILGTNYARATLNLTTKDKVLNLLKQGKLFIYFNCG